MFGINNLVSIGGVTYEQIQLHELTTTMIVFGKTGHSRGSDDDCY